MSNIVQFPGARSARISYGPNGDDAERAEALANLDRHYNEMQARYDAAKANAREVTPETFVARVEYEAHKNDPTPNADGVHVGDLFYDSWGYEQTNVDFYQVVALKGMHTAILRKIGGEYVGGYSWQGKVRPERGSFIGDEITARTRKSPWDGKTQVHGRRDRWMDRTTDDAEHDYTSCG